MRVAPDTIMKFIGLVNQMTSITEEQLEDTLAEIIERYQSDDDDGGIEPADLIKAATIFFLLYLKDIGVTHGG